MNYVRLLKEKSQNYLKNAREDNSWMDKDWSTKHALENFCFQEWKTVREDTRAQFNWKKELTKYVLQTITDTHSQQTIYKIMGNIKYNFIMDLVDIWVESNAKQEGSNMYDGISMKLSEDGNLSSEKGNLKKISFTAAEFKKIQEDKELVKQGRSFTMKDIKGMRRKALYRRLVLDKQPNKDPAIIRDKSQNLKQVLFFGEKLLHILPESLHETDVDGNFDSSPFCLG